MTQAPVLEIKRISQETLDKIKDLANESIDHVLLGLGFDIDNVHGFAEEIRCACPIHGGDNPSAFSYSTRFKQWRCFTAKCHEGCSSIFGLTQKVLGIKEDREVSFAEAVRWLAGILEADIGLETPQTDNDREMRSFIKEAKTRRRLCTKQTDVIDEAKFKPFSVKLIDGKVDPSRYFLNQGFSESVLRKYNVGFCSTSGKPMYLRSYAPVLDETGETVIGVTGRTIHEKCEYCPDFHPKGQGCPKDNPKVRSYPKWLHYGFRKNFTFYNYSFAQSSIKDTKVAILTEGPKDIWWFVQHGIENCLSVFGLSVSDYHLKHLVKLGVIKVVLAFDRDRYGIEATKKLDQMFGGYFDVVEMQDLFNYGEDVADVSTDKMNKVILPFIKGINENV
jgi:hypothetical protein